MTYQSFNSFDEMFDAIQAASKEADAQVKPWQQVEVGSYAYRQEEGFDIYVEILDPLNGLSEPEEIAYTKETYAEPHMKHYRFARSFSILVEDGELGDIHVSTISGLLSKEQFELARSLGWPSIAKVLS